MSIESRYGLTFSPTLDAAEVQRLRVRHQTLMYVHHSTMLYALFTWLILTLGAILSLDMLLVGEVELLAKLAAGVVGVTLLYVTVFVLIPDPAKALRETWLDDGVAARIGEA